MNTKTRSLSGAGEELCQALLLTTKHSNCLKPDGLGMNLRVLASQPLPALSAGPVRGEHYVHILAPTMDKILNTGFSVLGS